MLASWLKLITHVIENGYNFGGNPNQRLLISSTKKKKTSAMCKTITGSETLTHSMLHMETINKSRQSTCTILTRPTTHRTEVAPVKSSDTFSICTDFQLQKMH